MPDNSVASESRVSNNKHRPRDRSMHSHNTEGGASGDSPAGHDLLLFGGGGRVMYRPESHDLRLIQTEHMLSPNPHGCSSRITNSLTAIPSWGRPCRLSAQSDVRPQTGWP